MSKVLYHYTARWHLQSIMRSKFLKLTESNLRADITMYKPVVWLTTLKDPDEQALGLNGSTVDKTELRITVRKQPHYMWWNKFSKRHKIDKEWQKLLEENRKPKTWFVSERIIPLEDILKIENRYTGEIYYEQK